MTKPVLLLVLTAHALDQTEQSNAQADLSICCLNVLWDTFYCIVALLSFKKVEKYFVQFRLHNKKDSLHSCLNSNDTSSTGIQTIGYSL